MSSEPKYYDVFASYFENSDEPSLSDFIQKYKHVIVAYHEDKDDLRRLWSSRFSKAFDFYFNNIPKDERPKMDIKDGDWGSVALEFLSKITKQRRESAATTLNRSDNKEFSDEPDTATTTSTVTGTKSTSSIPPITSEFIDIFRQTYENMMDEEKWKLCSGRFVEEVLFSFGLTCRHEHSCHSFILDLADEDVRKQFTNNELADICNKEAHPLPSISPQLLEYLNSFINLKTIEDLEKRARKRLYNFDEEFDLDWAQSSIQNAIRLFHAKFFPLTDQTEADIIRRVWPFVDTIFDNTNVDVRTGEMESTASSERKNEQRIPNQRKKHGHKTDILFKAPNGEIGCSEVGKKDSGDAGTKEVKELGLKVPKMMKDQLWQLIRNHPEKSRRLAVIGYVMMGLKLRVVVMDNPSTYICKINRTPAYYFPSTIETFGSRLGNLLGLVSQVKELVCKTIDILNEPLPVQSTSYTPIINTPVQMLPCPPSPKLPSKKSSSNSEQ